MNEYISGDTVVRLNRVSKEYGDSERKTKAVSDISLTAGKRELVLVLGPSGSGKTTLLSLIAGFIQPSAGDAFLFGKPIKVYGDSDLQSVRAGRMGFVFQNFMLLESLTVLENIKIVLRFTGVTGSRATRRAMEFLSHFEVDRHASKYPHQLSQGEKQRVAVARAVVNDAELILADEPTASLESSQGFEIIGLLTDYAFARGACVVVASHDTRIEKYASTVLRMQDGRIV
jgi:putative ABC transport system ATP-binding protein